MKIKKNYKKNRTLIGIACAILAILVVFLINPLFSKAFSAKTTIVRLSCDISEGEKIEKNMLNYVEVGRYGLPEDVITDMDEVIGYYASADLFKDDYLLPSKLVLSLTTADLMFSRLDGSRQAMSLSITNFEEGLSGKLSGGDIISIVVNDSEDEIGFIPEELQYVQVITATTKEGIDTDDYKSLQNTEDTLPSTVTVLVTKTQAELLAKYNKDKSMHFILVCRRGNDNAERLLLEQDKLLGVEAAVITPEEDEPENENSEPENESEDNSNE